MKKIVSILLCLALLFSFGAFASAEEAPQLKLTASKQWSDDKSGLYACFEYSIRNCPDFESCQLIITYNPAVLQYVNGYPFPLDDEVRKQTICTVLEPGTLQVIGNDNDYGSHEFDPFCLKVIGEGDTDIYVELVSFKTADGEVENVKFDADIQNFTVEEAPQLKLTASKASADAFSAAPGQYVNFICSFRNCSYFESFEILITYNPEVLQYSAVYPLPKTEVVKHAIDCTVIQPGKLQVIGNNTCGYGGSNEFDPFCLKVIGEGDTDISVELVSFKTADGEVESVKFDADIQNFTVEEAPQLTLRTHSLREEPYNSTIGRYIAFRFAIENCPDFESFRVKITYNPEVLEPYRGYPADLEAIMRNSIELTKESDGTLFVDGLKHEDAFKGDFDPFCFKVIGKGDTDISVELVSCKTADGEIENINFDATVRNFTVTQVYIKYDLNWDEAVTAEDARLALRFAVGLDAFTDDQLYAAGLVSGDGFTSSLARYILRTAVGLPV